MAKVKGLKQTKYKISQTINLEDEFGVSFKGRPDLRQKIGQAVIDKIVQRTESNRDVNGKQLPKYSDSYVKSKQFRRYGKSSSDINMTLKGDMMTSLDITKETGNSVTIGFDDKTSEAKAANHNQGITGKKREFFGVNQSELNQIKSEFRSELKTLDKKPTESTRETLELLGSLTAAEVTAEQTAINRLFSNLFGGLDDGI